MRFLETGLDGLWLIEPEYVRDSRGAFGRVFCEQEFSARRLETRFVQHSQSVSWKRGTRRGLHFQLPPHDEIKIVSCIAGCIWDVVVDIRRDSSSYGAWYAVELSPSTGRQLYIPRGFAHGFQSLTDDAVTQYLISDFYAPASARGVAHDDPDIKIAWPEAPAIMSQKDQGWPTLSELLQTGVPIEQAAS
ncbi:dTDP-4-dehydrorhamnose 3,5-epimerase [Qingshengfaniella alkalisoli]|uniref:dTDP-4-dehydrorhamnose 3,5-epimerase n=1 Tax=Qingshengfaniella alkalisoli TaxID=2599296 RepID=A0A5B8IWD8_9RHOB|nr:dTDP-4-dehydrorhamnose 3,5-epimerase [Qingshengfaniella alkalisoli]QDY70472.1 dTDP-4-dehydrorhamnose 3,5-epimerase [Qingshengfaniella alkalisoli]